MQYTLSRFRDHGLETWLESSTWKRAGIKKVEHTLKIMAATHGMWHLCVSDLLVTDDPGKGGTESSLGVWKHVLQSSQGCTHDAARHQGVSEYNEMKAKTGIKEQLFFSKWLCVYVKYTFFFLLSGC